MTEYQPNPDLMNLLRDADKPYALLSVGIPGSRKTEAMEVISSDLGIELISIGALKNIDEFMDRRAMGIAWRRLLQKRARDVIKLGGSVAIDSHHIYPDVRAKVIDNAKRSGAAAIVGLVFDTDVKHAMRHTQSVTGSRLEDLHRIYQQHPVAYREDFDVIVDHEQGFEGPSIIRPL